MQARLLNQSPREYLRTTPCDSELPTDTSGPLPSHCRGGRVWTPQALAARMGKTV